MRLPLSWLKEYLPLNDLSPNRIADTLTLAGIEVEKSEELIPSFDGVVVAKILSVAPHPQADKLRIATVFDGQENLQIVCGAPNCREGMKTALAKIGATLHDPTGKSWKIKKSKLREVESFGMLCSGVELGISQEDEGILDLPQDLAEGTPLAPLYTDHIFDLSLTPNLGHCLSLLGIARELSALLNLPLHKKTAHFQEDQSKQIDKMLTVHVDERQACMRYACRMLTDVAVTSSPHWLKKRIESCGLRSVNNIVDCANYIMLETGQPLHIFDYDTLSEKKILVTTHAPAPSMKGLDDNLYEIPKEALLICDPQHTLACAGIIGSADSAVTEKTKNILIESAYFSSRSIRKTSKELSLRTEASLRFERGTDPAAVVEILNYAAQLIQQTAGGAIVSGLIDCKSSEFPRKELTCRISKVNQLLGAALSKATIIDCLRRLEIHLLKEEGDILHLSIPTYRHDLNAEIDLIEEVARVFGYNQLPKKTPLHVSSPIGHDPNYLFENEMRSKLIEQELQECLTCNLISPLLAGITLVHPSSAQIAVLHPRSVDQSILRASLLPGLLQMIKGNLDRQVKSISAFEVGRIHYKDKEKYKEELSGAIILTGKRSPYHWQPKPDNVDFFDLKGRIENLLFSLGISELTFEPSHLHPLHPWRQARIKKGEMQLGVLGELHPSTLGLLDIDQPVFFAELHLPTLALLKRKNYKALPICAYPSSERDWTLTVPETLPIAFISQLVDELNSPLLESIELLDLYKSEQIGKDRKNVTFRLSYRDTQKTIEMDAVEKEHAMITRTVAEKLFTIK